MHAQGDPRTMQESPLYADVVLDVYDWLGARIDACERAGIPRTRLIVDPGIGFGKTLAHNLALLGALGMFHGLGCAGAAGRLAQELHRQADGSRCGAIACPGSIAAALLGAAQGVQILRVHDVAATRQALAVWEACAGRLITPLSSRGLSPGPSDPQARRPACRAFWHSKEPVEGWIRQQVPG